MNSDTRTGLRDRLGQPLTANKFAASVELLVVPLLLGLQAIGVLTKPKLLLLLFAWASLWLRRVGWRRVGLLRPASWMATVLAAILIGLAYDALDIKVFLPLLRRLTGEPMDLAAFAALKGNTGLLLLLTGASWLSGALVEEMLYRGYILNRLADVLGRTTAGWVLSVALVSAAFGLAHHAQGTTGVLDSILAGFLFAGLYLASRRNLWLPILAHGVIDTASIVALYLGFNP